MTYETAKKLKDAGFKVKDCIRYPDGIPLSVCDNFNDESKPAQECLLVPSLSELIEACGDDFFSLQATAPERMSLSRRYIANGFTYDRPPLEGGQKRAVQGGIHKTPEEAVANLWLRLNDKKE